MGSESSCVESEAPASAAAGERLGDAYERSPEREQQEQDWILQHLPLVQRLVERLAHDVINDVDREDLVSAGTLGLIKAARAFDPDKGAQFRTYATTRIRGAILDEMRHKTFTPVAAHQHLQRLEEAYRSFYATNGRPPSDKELSRELEVSLDELGRWLTQARRQQFLSIHGLVGESQSEDDVLPLPDSVPPDREAAAHETQRALAAAIESLPERHRQVILLYYDRELTMKEIAAVFQVSEPRVSQLHAAAIFRLSMEMQGES